MGTTKPHSVCQVNGAKKVTISPSNDEAQSCCANPLLLDPIALSGLPPVTIRASRKDKHLLSTPPRWLFRLAEVARQVTGSIRMPSLPPFTMSRSSSNPIPATPRVISPSPTPSESREASQEGYFGPVTRSARKKQAASEAPIDEEDVSAELRRARSKSRSPMRARKISGLTSAKPTTTPATKPPPLTPNGNGHAAATNGHLSPTSANSGWSWRDISRSPSPLGL